MPSSKFEWHKISQPTPELRRRALKKWDRSVRVEQYRMEPPPGMAFGAIGSFHWPSSDYPPDEVFGLNYEALDPIRMSCKCYVLYDRAKKEFRVMGNIDNVLQAVQLIRNTSLQLAARSISNVRLYLLHWPDASAMPTNVRLVQHELTPVVNEPSTRFVHSPCAMGIESANPAIVPGEKQTILSHQFLRQAVLQTLKKLHFHRGAIEMRLTLGTLVAEQFRQLPEDAHTKAGYKLSEYVDMIRESQFRGCVTEALGDRAVETQAHERLKSAQGLLVPDIMYSSIDSVKPVYSATFTFADPLGDYRYTTSWKDTSADPTRPEYDSIARGWCRLDADAKRPRALLDIALTSLSVGSPSDINFASSVSNDNLNAASSWHFAIDTSTPIQNTRVPPQLAHFEKTIKFDAECASKINDGQFVTCYDLPSLTSVRQRITYSYKIANSDYALEVTRFQDRNRHPETKDVDVYVPRWSVSIHRPDWEAMFEQNERLVAGQGTKWADDSETWFPCDCGPDKASGDDGFAQLMEKLQRVATIVRSI